MDSMDEPRSPSLPTSPAASIIVFPLPSTLSSSSFSGQYGVQRNRGQLTQPPEERFRLLFRLSGPSSGFTWRLAGVELPARVRDQLVQQLVRREATAVPR